MWESSYWGNTLHGAVKLSHGRMGFLASLSNLVNLFVHLFETLLIPTFKVIKVPPGRNEVSGHGDE